MHTKPKIGIARPLVSLPLAKEALLCRHHNMLAAKAYITESRVPKGADILAAIGWTRLDTSFFLRQKDRRGLNGYGRCNILQAAVVRNCRIARVSIPPETEATSIGWYSGSSESQDAR